MEIKWIKKEQMMTTRWSGGTTTQVDLYPESATYQDRNFIFRVSSATIEESPSNFTALPDYQRWIVMLSHGVVLEHPTTPGRTIRLEPLQVYGFDGGLPTCSVGKTRDFNLMLAKGHVGDLLRLSPGIEFNASAYLSDRQPQNLCHLAFFCLEQENAVQRSPELSSTEDQFNLNIDYEADSVILKPGDYVRFTGTVSSLKTLRAIQPKGAGGLVLYMET